MTSAYTELTKEASERGGPAAFREFYRSQGRAEAAALGKPYAPKALGEVAGLAVMILAYHAIPAVAGDVAPRAVKAVRARFARPRTTARPGGPQDTDES
ncbi:hypothetical protein [Streptomyces fuscigenes]|uniref:hypothetical protein n=1 Tax=Streptomyces fuscigenes TaxID=1528880 RepID=UPI001F2E999E|nr:hypothetical protein [Streptomyces fuscigenes]MCF3960273.1 hypothetical protein [Streptomyces fuscigenes]